MSSRALLSESFARIWRRMFLTACGGHDSPCMSSAIFAFPVVWIADTRGRGQSARAAIRVQVHRDFGKVPHQCRQCVLRHRPRNSKIQQRHVGLPRRQRWAIQRPARQDGDGRPGSRRRLLQVHGHVIVSSKHSSSKIRRQPLCAFTAVIHPAWVQEVFAGEETIIERVDDWRELQQETADVAQPRTHNSWVRSAFAPCQGRLALHV